MVNAAQFYGAAPPPTDRAAFRAAPALKTPAQAAVSTIQEYTCDFCDGTGVGRRGDPCDSCAGTGKIQVKPQNVMINIHRKLNVFLALMALIAPWFVFSITYSTLSFDLRYSVPAAAYTVAFLTLLLAGAFGYLAYVHCKMRADADATAEPRWFVFMFATALLAWLAAHTAGTANYFENMRPYYDVNNLNTYEGIDPTDTRGQELMDAGQVVFTKGSHLDLSKSMGFKSYRRYCVAPIAGANDTTLSSYDFWAIGVDCCTSNVGDYHCGDFNNPFAKHGLRLMNDQYRDYFRLAVQQAEASYNIRASHPLFFYWMQDSVDEIDAYAKDGHRAFVVASTSWFLLQLVLTAMAAWTIGKVDT